MSTDSFNSGARGGRIQNARDGDELTADPQSVPDAADAEPLSRLGAQHHGGHPRCRLVEPDALRERRGGDLEQAQVGGAEPEALGLADVGERGPVRRDLWD